MPAGNFYVYEHWRMDKGLPFYVGKGRDIRAYAGVDGKDHCGRNKHHRNICLSLKKKDIAVEVRIVFNNLPEDMSFSLEKSQIAYWKRRGIELTNQTEGGSGGITWEPSPEYKALSSQRLLDIWQDPSSREERVAAIILGNQSKEVRSARSKAMKKKWADPDFRKSQVAVQTAAQQRLETREKIGITSKQNQSSPEYRAQMSATLVEVWKRPDYQAGRKKKVSV